MQGSIAHFILTRFNLATFGRETGFRTQPGWLESRFNLFERFCLPTVAAQTAKDFEWLIFFDEQTPKVFRDRITLLQGLVPFSPVFVQGAEAPVARVVRSRLRERHEWVLTTRLDNDDGISVDFCERLRRSVQNPRVCVLNFTNGFVLSRSKLYTYRHESNAFASLLELNDNNLRTIFSIPHVELKREFEVVQIAGQGAWLQVVHGGNVSNRIHGHRIFPITAIRLFPQAIFNDLHENQFGHILDNLLFWPARTVRDKFVAIAKRILGRRLPVIR